MEYIKPEKIIELFKEKFNDSVTNNKIEIKTAGLKKNSYSLIWLEIELKDFKDAVKLLCAIQFPHFAIISGSDIVVNVLKNNLKIPTITDLIPGAQTAEREIKEMLGVTVEGLPDLANIFLPKDFPKDVYPLRKDETGAAKMVNKVEEEVKKVE
jgi:membrane-bound hydrogenase subunit beta